MSKWPKMTASGRVSGSLKFLKSILPNGIFENFFSKECLRNYVKRARSSSPVDTNNSLSGKYAKQWQPWMKTKHCVNRDRWQNEFNELKLDGRAKSFHKMPDSSFSCIWHLIKKQFYIIYFVEIKNFQVSVRVVVSQNYNEIRLLIA